MKCLLQCLEHISNSNYFQSDSSSSEQSESEQSESEDGGSEDAAGSDLEEGEISGGEETLDKTIVNTGKIQEIDSTALNESSTSETNTAVAM